MAGMQISGITDRNLPLSLSVRILIAKVVLWAGQSPNEQLRGGDVNPGFGARDRSLEILCQAAVPIEPGEGSFDDPSARQQLEAGSGALDDLDCPVTEFGEGVTPVGGRCRHYRRRDVAARETTDGRPR